MEKEYDVLHVGDEQVVVETGEVSVEETKYIGKGDIPCTDLQSDEEVKPSYEDIIQGIEFESTYETYDIVEESEVGNTTLNEPSSDDIVIPIGVDGNFTYKEVKRIKEGKEMEEKYNHVNSIDSNDHLFNKESLKKHCRDCEFFLVVIDEVEMEVTERLCRFNGSDKVKGNHPACPAFSIKK